MEILARRRCKAFLQGINADAASNQRVSIGSVPEITNFLCNVLQRLSIPWLGAADSNLNLFFFVKASHKFG